MASISVKVVLSRRTYAIVFMILSTPGYWLFNPWGKDLQFIAGVQILAAFWYGAMTFHHLTGAGTGTSFLIGGGGALALVMVVVMKFPRLLLGTATLGWAIGGVMLGHWLFGGIGQALVVGLILAGVGFMANAVFIAEMRTSHDKGVAIAEAVLPPTISAQDRKGVVILWHAARRLDRIGVLDDQTFRTLDGRCAEILGMPNPPDGSDPARINDVADAFEAVSVLKSNGLISDHVANRTKDRIEDWWASRTAPSSTKALSSTTAAMTVAGKDGLTDTDKEILAGQLYRLIENRTLSFETFARVMVELDPSYDLSRISAQMFPFEDDADAGDLQVVERLRKLDLITVAEYRRGLQVILPYLHEKSA